MAKQQAANAIPATAESASGELSLAERLFAANWRPGSGYTAEHLAHQCLDAADDFKKAESERQASVN